MSPVTDQKSVFHCNDYGRNEVFDTFYEDYYEFKHYMNNTYKTITPRFDLITNISNVNVSLQAKIKSLEEEIKSLKNGNSDLNGEIKSRLNVTENLSRVENRHCEDSVTNKDKVNVNYKSDDLKIKIKWQMATSRNKHYHFTNTGKNSFEKNRKSSDIYFDLSNRMIKA